MKKKLWVGLFGLTLLILILSGCQLSWLGELILREGFNSTDSISGIVLDIQSFELDSTVNQFILNDLSEGEKVILALSPWDSSTFEEGNYYELRVSVERTESTYLTLEGFTELPTLTVQTSDRLVVESSMNMQQGSDDYRTYEGDLAGLTTVNSKQSELSLQDNSRIFFVNSDETYIQILGTLVAQGQHLQVYVDDAVISEINTDIVDQVISTFDSVIYSKVTDTFGYPWDKDGNGKVILLITPLMYKGSATRLIGYFDETNFFDKTENNNSNVADMFYLNANVVNGNLRTVYANLAHEFQHLIFGGAKLLEKKNNSYDARFINYSDIWINEGFSVLASHLTGYGNLETDPRIYDRSYGYFAQPHRDGLLTWEERRSDSNYGSAGLFAYYLYDHYRGVIKNILHSSLTAEQTIAEYVGQGSEKDFAKVFRNWMIANITDGMKNVNDTRYRYNRLNLQSAPVVDKLIDDDNLGIWGMGVKYYLIEGNGEELKCSFTDSWGGRDIPMLNGALIFIKTP